MEPTLVLSVISMRKLSEVYRGVGEHSDAKAMTEHVQKIGYVD